MATLTQTGSLRDHTPVIMNKFNGLFSRGNPEEVPEDHFTDCSNIRFVGGTAFGTRYGLGIYQSVSVPLGNVVRMYNYITASGSNLLCLTWDGTTGKIYHVVSSTLIYGPILSIVGMTDFAFVPYNGRAYISPFTSTMVGALSVESGMSGQALYVYLGTGLAAQQAAGATPAGTITVANGAAGFTDPGVHIFGVVGETNTGFLSAPCAFLAFTTNGTNSVSIGSIPVFSGAQWVKRHIVSTQTIASFNGNLTGYTFYFIPGADILDNTTLFLNNISFYDVSLIQDATHLLNNFATIPAGAALGIYHNRLCLAATNTNISLIYVSSLGEPEAIDQVNGLCIVPPDGNPITQLQEMRDVLYAFKRDKTVSFVDNGDVPSSWPLSFIDNALGCPVHGIATVLDSGSSSVNMLIVASYQGIMLFNGVYAQPELSWKIKFFWQNLDQNNFKLVTIVNDPLNQLFYVTLPDYTVLFADYANGMTSKLIRWAPWRFNIAVTAIALVNVDNLILAGQ